MFSASPINIEHVKASTLNEASLIAQGAGIQMDANGIIFTHSHTTKASQNDNNSFSEQDQNERHKRYIDFRKKVHAMSLIEEGIMLAKSEDDSGFEQMLGGVHEAYRSNQMANKICQRIKKIMNLDSRDQRTALDKMLTNLRKSRQQIEAEIEHLNFTPKDMQDWKKFSQGYSR